MKKLFILIAACWGIMLYSCIDKEYDLSKVESDGIAIGNDNSEFVMPLAAINFKASNIELDIEEDLSLPELQNRVNIWLPTQLPNNVSYIDVRELIDSKEYRQNLLDNLYAEMMVDDNKRSAVCDYVVEMYRDEIIKMLKASPNKIVATTASEIVGIGNAEAAELISTLFITFPADVQLVFNEISDEDLINLNVEDVVIDIPALDLSEDVVRMITDNLDDDSVENPINALYLFGEADSDFPFLFHITPRIKNASVDFGEISIDNGVTKINDTRIFRDDFDVFVDGALLTIPIILDRYYPNSVLCDDNELNISISLRKTGGLKL